jgi:hypothetical protein
MISADDVVARLEQRRANQSQAISRMIAVRDAYHGDVVVPLPEIEESELPMVANLLNQGLEQMSLRIASVTPDIICPPRDLAQKREQTSAKKRRQALFGWWEFSRMDMKLAQRARHLLGYSQSYSWVRWCPKDEIPKWRTCDPLSTFPSDHFLEDHVNATPGDCITVYVRRMKELAEMYPMAKLAMLGSKIEPDTMIEVAEFADAEEYVLVAVGTRRAAEHPYSTAAFGNEMGGMATIELERYPNRAEMVPVGCAVRMGLDRPMSKFEGMLGMFQMQSRLMALEVLAVEKGIFADTWAVSRPGETVRIITPADGLRGIVGEIQGGELKEMQTNPGFMTNPTIDRLERNQRVTAGIPSDFGGESASNIRTGRRGDAVLSATVDFPIQESQRMLARSLQYENKVAINLAKAYAPNKPKSFYVGWAKAKGWTDYTPATDFVTDENIVSYASPGADLNDLVVGGGQRMGMGTMSKHRFMELDPLVEDPERERDLVKKEAMEEALLASIQQQASTGAIPPADLARIMLLVANDTLELAEAIEKVQKEAQARQATPAPAGSPETMPGLAQPGMGAEQPVAAQQPPGGLAGLRSLLGSLGGGEGGAPAGAPPMEAMA